jgi:hypothetical protein
MYNNNWSENVSFWTKGDLIDLAFEFNLLESERDADNFANALSFDDLADFVVYLFCGDWSRNITILTEEEQNDERVKKLFEYVDIHFKGR